MRRLQIDGVDKGLAAGGGISTQTTAGSLRFGLAYDDSLPML
jgi:hypothetical protein